MVSIYIIRLENNKFYVDSENDNNENRERHIPKVIQKHIEGNGGEWTEKFKPICLYKMYKKCRKNDVNKYTKIMMRKYGINNVRGGIYNKLKIEDKEKILLMKELGKDINNEEFIRYVDEDENLCCNICDKDFEELNEYIEHEYHCKERLNVCYICNKLGHYMSDCFYNKRSIIG